MYISPRLGQLAILTALSTSCLKPGETTQSPGTAATHSAQATANPAASPPQPREIQTATSTPSEPSEAPADAALVAPSPEALEQLRLKIEAHMKESVIPGALVAVVSKGEILYLGTFGMANVELSVPVSKETVFEIGSISKQFAAAAVMLQVEENKLELDESIHRYLPQLPGEWIGITARQLLTHTSGIPDYEEIASYDVYGFRQTPEQIIRVAHSRPMDFPPGTGWHYSNTGYFILSMLAERIDGKPFSEVLQSRIFEPLGMTSTRFADPETIIANRASGYWVNKNDTLINRRPTETSSTLGAGGLLSSVADLARWDAALNGETLLSAESKRTLWTPIDIPGVELPGWVPGYGMGWIVGSYRGLPAQWHGGQVAGFVSDFIRLKNQEAAIILFTNRYRIRTDPMLNPTLETFIPALQAK